MSIDFLLNRLFLTREDLSDISGCTMQEISEWQEIPTFVMKILIEYSKHILKLTE